MSDNKKQYKLVPPDGGWGYVVALSLAITISVTLHQQTIFGIVYGHYLRQITNEGSASTMMNGLFCTLFNFVGLITSHLIQKRSFRFVGIIGSILFFTGNMLSVFATSLWQLVLTFGVLQAAGMGIMLTTIVSSFNEYFNLKKNLMMGVAQTLIAAVSLILPYFSQMLMDQFGYRGTVAILAAISLHSLFAMLTLHPVKWHMVKVPLSDAEMSYLIPKHDNTKETTTSSRPKIIEESKSSKIRNLLSKFLLVSLLKDPVCVNIIVGLALVFMSDVMFTSLLPMFIYNVGYNNADTAYLMTVYTTSDLVGRILFSVFCAFVKIKMRIFVLIGFILTTVSKIIFTIYYGEWTVTFIFLSIVGFLRCFIQVPIPLVLAEYCNNVNFPSVYGIYGASLAVISIACGQLSSLVALNTTSDTWVLHFLTLHILFCVIPWIIEMLYHWKK